MSASLPTLHQGGVVLEGLSQLHDEQAERVESGIDGIDLRDLNTIRAFQMGIRVGIEAIQQVLSGSDVGPLGPKR